MSDKYYVEYTIQRLGEQQRHLVSVVGIGNNGWVNRLYTVTGQYFEEDSAKYKQDINKVYSYTSIWRNYWTTWCAIRLYQPSSLALINSLVSWTAVCERLSESLFVCPCADHLLFQNTVVHRSKTRGTDCRPWSLWLTSIVVKPGIFVPHASCHREAHWVGRTEVVV